MKSDVSKWMKKARESQNASEFLLGKSYVSISASQAFYTMFYVAKALLLAKGLAFSREYRVVNAFGKEFKKTDLANDNFHKNLVAACDVRNSNDFDLDSKVGKQEAMRMIQQSHEFYATARKYLDEQS